MILDAFFYHFLILMVLQSISRLSAGAFIGLSLEGNIVSTRADTNLRFYGEPNLKPIDILLGYVESPRVAAPLYTALDDLFSNMS